MSRFVFLSFSLSLLVRLALVIHCSLFDDCLFRSILISDSDPGFFKPSIQEVSSAMLQLGSDKRLDVPSSLHISCSVTHRQDNVRQLGMEFIVSLALNKPSMMKPIPNLARNYVNACLVMLTELDDDTLPEWNHKGRVAGDDDQEIQILNHMIAIEDLDRFTQGLGVKIFTCIILIRLSPGRISRSGAVQSCTCAS